MNEFSPLDLLELPERERKILLYVARHGSADAVAIADTTGYTIEAVEAVLTMLAAQGRLQHLPDHGITAQLGQVRPRTTLSFALDPQSFPSTRLYSEQQIAVLRTAIPMLQFARARLTTFNDHGPDHALRVKGFASQLGYTLSLTAREHHFLGAAALFHDIGNVVDRDRHHIISQETVEKLTTLGKLPFTPKEAEVVALLCRWHRKDYEPERVDTVRGETIRTGLLASILRVADAMDLDYRRADYDERFLDVIRFFYPQVMHYWMAMDALGIRFRYGLNLRIQIFTKGETRDNILINLLVKDLDSTPLNCHVQTLPVDGDLPELSLSKSLLVFPFEAHSLVMAALSRRQLQAAGSLVECLCYPDTLGSALWLWRDTLPDVSPVAYQRLIVIGYRPESEAAKYRLEMVRHWRASGVAVTLLNRHEVTWTQAPTLVDLGVDLILGNDWAYFWGDHPSTADIFWARVAAHCTRDHAIAAGSSAADLEVCHGLLAAVFDAVRRPAPDTASWQALAEPILDRIAADDREFYQRQAKHFMADFPEPEIAGQVQGNTIVFVGSPAQVIAANYWVMEHAIMQNGRKMERGIHFETPYAIATWPSDNGVELFAISHWREERALPIRLLYPSELGPLPTGNESSLHVQLTLAQAQPVIEAMIAACNRQEI